MPILCDPESTFNVWLKSDEAKSPRPEFIARCQSMRGQMKVSGTLDLMTSEEITTQHLFEETIKRLQEVLVGWKNMPEPYAPDKLWDYLNYSEARDLLRSVLYGSQLGPEEKKD